MITLNLFLFRQLFEVSFHLSGANIKFVKGFYTKKSMVFCFFLPEDTFSRIFHRLVNYKLVFQKKVTFENKQMMTLDKQE